MYVLFTHCVNINSREYKFSVFWGDVFSKNTTFTFISSWQCVHNPQHHSYKISCHFLGYTCNPRQTQWYLLLQFSANLNRITMPKSTFISLQVNLQHTNAKRSNRIENFVVYKSSSLLSQHIWNLSGKMAALLKRWLAISH